MTHKRLRGGFLVALCAIVVAMAVASLAQQQKKPNVLFVICDSMDGRLLLDDSPVSLPNLRALAGRGVLFSNTYSNSPECVPSRAALWSGRQVSAVKAWNNYKGLDANYTGTFLDLLVNNSYTPLVLGKTDYRSGAHSVSARVTAWTRSVDFPYVTYETKPLVASPEDANTMRVSLDDWRATDVMSDWLVHNATNTTQFFAYLGLYRPHPFGTPDSNFLGQDVDASSTFNSSSYWLRYVNESRVTVPPWTPIEDMHPYDYYQSMTKNMTDPSSNWTEAQIKDIRRYFYAMNAEVDAMVGQVMAALDKSGKANDTYVLFMSDHGEMAMEHRQYYKMAMYEASSRVPLVIAGPGVQPSVVTDITQLLDVFPTLMDMAGIRHPPNLDGYSLMPYFKKGQRPKQRPDYILSQYHSDHGKTSAYMIRKGQYKYIAFGNGTWMMPQLFDLSTDPNETTNLVQSNPSVALDMEKLLRAVIDYPSVTAEVDQYNLASFLEWRQSLGQNYTVCLENVRWFWDFYKHPEYVQLVNGWADSRARGGNNKKPL